MKKYLLILFSIFIFANTIFSQTPTLKQWDYKYGGFDNDEIYDFHQTKDHGFILGGLSYSDSSGDKTQPLWGFWDYWIVKLDSSGIKQWDKRFGTNKDDALQAVEQTNDGGYILGGWTSGKINGDKTQNSRGQYDYWIVKTDSIGNKMWDKRYGANQDEYMTAVKQTTDGGYILGGYSSSGISGDKTEVSRDTICLGGICIFDYWIVKIDSVGNKQWDKTFGGTEYDYLNSLQQTSDGGFILGGQSSSDSSGDKTQPSWGQYDYWIVKIDSLGNKQWDKRYGGSAQDSYGYILQTLDGGYIIGGISDSNISGDMTQTSKGLSDYWIVKIDSLGNKEWDKRYGGNSLDQFFYTISLTSDSGYLLSGVSGSPISGDKTEDNLGYWQSWIVKTDSLGIKQWDKTIFTLGHEQSGYCVETADGCFAVANNCEAGIGGYKSQNGWLGSPDYWIVKLCASGLPLVNLSSTDTTFCEKKCIDFFDLSTNNPTSWQWLFPGADTTSSTLQNPTNICYNSLGSFDVTLIACNSVGCDTLVLHNFINEYQNPVDSIWAANDTLFSLPAANYQWFEVSAGLISGEINQYFVPSQIGSYYCVTNDTNGCIATSNTIVLTSLDQLSTVNSQFSIVPNPFNDEIRFTLLNNLPSEVILYDLTSQLVLRQEFKNSIVLNTEKLARGIYICELRTYSKSNETLISKIKVTKQ